MKLFLIGNAGPTFANYCVLQGKVDILTWPPLNFLGDNHMILMTIQLIDIKTI